MVTQERHSKILSQLRDKEFVEVTELAAQLGVSVETIRRDLNSLEASGLLKRIHGGAASVEEKQQFAFGNQETQRSSVEAQAIQQASFEAQAIPQPQPGHVIADLAWFSPARPPFKLCGFPFFEQDGVYRRFPLNPPETLPVCSFWL